MVSLTDLFSGLNSATNTAKLFKELLQKKRGNVRLLLEELKKNSTLCWLVVERDVESRKIIPQLSIKTYDILLEQGFDFNELSPKSKKIRGNPNLKDSDLSSFIGKDIANLIEGIYDRIKEVQLIFQVDPDTPRIDWKRRVINLHKRILLLMSHLQDWK